MRSRSSRTLAGVALALVILTAAAGCGTDEKSASEQVCDARKDLSDSVDKVADEVKAGNLGDAKDDLAAVSSSFADLASAFGKLTDQQKSDLQQQVDKLKSDANALTDASTKDELSSAVD